MNKPKFIVVDDTLRKMKVKKIVKKAEPKKPRKKIVKKIVKKEEPKKPQKKIVKKIVKKEEPKKPKKKIVKKIVKKEEPKKPKKKIVKKIVKKEEPKKPRKKIVKKVEPKKPPEQKDDTFMKGIKNRLYDYLRRIHLGKTKQTYEQYVANRKATDKYKNLSDKAKIRFDNIVKEVKNDKEFQASLIRDYGEKKELPKPIEPTIANKPKTMEELKEEFLNKFLDLTTKEGTSFRCYDAAQSFIFLQILKKYKNDCVLRFYDRKEKRFISDVKDVSFMLGKVALLLPTSHLSNQYVVAEITKTAMECKKRGKLLVIQMLPTDTHANIMIVNTLTNRIEYYEPHGQGRRAPQINRKLEILAKRINSVSKGELNLTASTLENSCPRLPFELTDMKYNPQNKLYGLQIFETGKLYSKQRELKIFGNSFLKHSGFCCAWSFLQMELRLRFPYLPENEMASKFVSMLKNNKAETLRDFIFGYANQLINYIYNALKAENKIKAFINVKGGGESFNILRRYLYEDFAKLGGDIQRWRN
jgi:hypothetical protein